MRRYFFTMMMAVLAVMTAAAETFTGRVVDETQAPVPLLPVRQPRPMASSPSQAIRLNPLSRFPI